MPADKTQYGGSDRDSQTTGQALTVVHPAPSADRPRPSRLTDALFLAHMFATRFRAPQTCEKRRADPRDADASYRQAKKPAARTGRVLSRKI